MSGEELPKGWAWATLDDLTQVVGGVTKGQKRAPFESVRSVPYLRVANVQRGFLDLKEVKQIEATEAEIAELRLLPGDLLLNEGGDRDKLGRGWVWSGEVAECIHQNHVFRARPRDSGIDSKYISHYANSFGQRFFVAAGAQTTNLASVSLSKVRCLPVPLPPVPEQRRIVAKLDELTGRVRRASEALDAIPALLERYRQSVLAAAFRGELTREWRRQNGADVGGRESLPPTWNRARLGDLAPLVTSGSRAWSKFYGRGTGTFVLAQNVRPGFLDLSFRQAVDPPSVDPDRLRSEIKKGDVLVTIVGANTGDVAPVLSDYSEHYVCQSVALIRPVEPAFGEFLSMFLLTSAKGGSLKEAIYGAGRPHLSLEQLRSVEVPLPPLDEQAELLKRLRDALASIARMKEHIAELEERREVLTRSLLTRAFRGELVPQDPADEPASVLLERLRAERAAAPASAGRRGRKPKAAQGELPVAPAKKR